MKCFTLGLPQLIATFAVATLLISETEASKKFVTRIPNGANVPNTPAIGHPDATGESSDTNAFGDAFEAAGKKWTKELCMADSDGDGQTNGQELGDPCCTWDQTANPVVLWTTGVSHPSDASKTSDPSLWANGCGSSTPSISSAPSSSSSQEAAISGSNTPSTYLQPVMKSSTALRLFGIMMGTALLVPGAEASFEFVAMLPNGGNVPDTPAIGHPDGTGESSATNAFGDAFSEAGNKWTKELCEADTDGDGQTNGQELGDPCCEWDMDTNSVVLWTEGVSHPDDATKTNFQLDRRQFNHDHSNGNFAQLEYPDY
ncbi:hypothetical protein BBP00_00004356 [Phytophthora kernoviae]|uniref:Temptin Cys/Cys disulfide domain-containing protein n=1 Tax=Phytophthora kernoviae TaxID=325452 RepID=A0A3F2RRX5_9STRA|nr:hypothetical protein BBP00_00004356 [Phytophthora kernoviae]